MDRFCNPWTVSECESFPQFAVNSQSLLTRKGGAMSITQETHKIIQLSHRNSEWQRKFFAMAAKCYYCGVPLTLKSATKDHRIPRCRGGSDSIKNIVPACLACNQKKGWKTEQEYFALLDGERMNSQICAVPTLKPSTHLPTQPRSLDLLDSNWGKIKQESESFEASWAWRNPA